jgi:hypothetical protein
MKTVREIMTNKAFATFRTELLMQAIEDGDFLIATIFRD